MLNSYLFTCNHTKEVPLIDCLYLSVLSRKIDTEGKLHKGTLPINIVII